MRTRERDALIFLCIVLFLAIFWTFVRGDEPTAKTYTTMLTAGSIVDGHGETWVFTFDKPTLAGVVVPFGVTLTNVTIKVVCSGDCRIRGVKDTDPNRPTGDRTDAPDESGTSGVFVEDGGMLEKVTASSDFGDGIRYEGAATITDSVGIGSRIGVFTSNSKGARLTGVTGKLLSGVELFSPRSGYGFEPNQPDEVVQDIELVNCVADGSSGPMRCGLYVGAQRTKQPIDVRGNLTVLNLETYDTPRKAAGGPNGSGGYPLAVSDQATGLPLNVDITVETIWKR